MWTQDGQVVQSMALDCETASVWTARPLPSYVGKPLTLSLNASFLVH